MEKVWGDYYRGGGLVLSDRYTTSNAVHQASKLPEAEWEGFFRWLFDFECGKLGLPLPDLVVYLDMPTEQAVRLLRSREASTHTKGDIHEVDTGYLALCAKPPSGRRTVWAGSKSLCRRGGALHRGHSP